MKTNPIKPLSKQMKSIKGVNIQGFLFVALEAAFRRPLRPLWQDTETSKGQSFLLNYFWVRCDTGSMESLKFTSSRNAYARAAVCCKRWKAARFHAPSKPLTRREKIWHQASRKKDGNNNAREKWTIPLWALNINHTLNTLKKNNAFLFAFQKWQTTLVTGFTLSIPITQEPEANQT